MDILPDLNELALEIAVRVILGDDVCTASRLAEFEAAYRDFTAGAASPFAVEIPFTPFARGAAARRRLLAILDDVIAERERGGDGRGRRDALSLLLAARDDGEEEEGAAKRAAGLTMAAVKDNVLSLLFAGHVTTSKLASWLLLFTLPEGTDAGAAQPALIGSLGSSGGMSHAPQ